MKTFMISPNYDAEGAGGGGAPGGDAKWYGTPDTETLGYITARGLDKMTANDAALASIQAHREAEKLMGVPADQLLRFPKDLSDVDGWNKIHTKMGVPVDPKDYDFSTVKTADGNPLTEDVANTMRGLVAELKIPKATASVLVQKLVDLSNKSNEGDSAVNAAELALEVDKLAKNWGFNAAANQVISDNAKRALGITDEQKEALKGVIGHAAVEEMFRNIGARIGEDNFITNPTPGGQKQVMTSADAQYRLDQLQNDSVWLTKLNNGDAATLNEFNTLTTMVTMGKK